MAFFPTKQWWTLDAGLMSYESPIVRFITVTSLFLGLALLLPLIVFLIIDLTLWSWRMIWNREPVESESSKDSGEQDQPAVSSPKMKDDLGAQATRRR